VEWDGGFMIEYNRRDLLHVDQERVLISDESSSGFTNLGLRHS
jgi:hypothetical protein